MSRPLFVVKHGDSEAPAYSLSTSSHEVPTSELKQPPAPGMVSTEEIHMINRMVPVLCLMTIVLTLFPMPVQGQAAEPTAIGSRVELFVDPFLIDRLDGVEQQLHPPLDGETVLAFDKPWEGRYCGYVTVIKDADRYRLYYRGLPIAGKDGSAAEVTCYAESQDGITFMKPNLGLFDISGSRDNNVILANLAPFSHNFAPFLDARKDAPAEERFKALAEMCIRDRYRAVNPYAFHMFSRA